MNSLPSNDTLYNISKSFNLCTNLTTVNDISFLVNALTTGYTVGA